MGPILAIALKDLRLLLRDRAALFFSTGFPLVYAIFFGSIFSGAGSKPASGIAIAVVDTDHSQGSRDFIADLEASDSFSVAPFDTREAAQESVRKGRHTAMIVVEPGFGAALDNPFAGDSPTLTIGTDPARKAEAGMIEGLLTERLFTGLQSAFTDAERARSLVRNSIDSVRNDPEIPPLTRGVLLTFLNHLDTFAGDFPVVLESESPDKTDDASGFQLFSINTIDVTSAEPKSGKPRVSFDISFPQGIAWGVMGVAAGFGLSLVVERTKGTMLRLRVSPVSPARLLLGKAVGCFITIIAVISLLIAVGILGFGVRPESPPLLAAAVISTAVGFVGIMMIASVLGKTEAAAGGITWAMLTMMAMIGGGMIPLMFLPAWMQPISSISPVKWAILSLEGAIWRGFTPADMLLPCGILLAVGIVGYTVGATIFIRRAEP